MSEAAVWNVSLHLKTTDHSVTYTHALSLSQTTFRPKDLSSFLAGYWKRNLEWREFGGPFGFLRSSNTVVLIEEQQSLIGEPSVKHLRWSFGASLAKKDLRFGYVMNVTPVEGSQDSRLDWEYIGVPCRGEYVAATGVSVLNFFQKLSSVVVTYRILDQDTMAVCVIEAEANKPAILQYGNMLRIDPDAYAKYGSTSTS